MPHDLRVFFSVTKEPTEVTPKDVMAFVTAQRRPQPGAEKVVRIAAGSSGLSAATIKRRLAAVSSPDHSRRCRRDQIMRTPWSGNWITFLVPTQSAPGDP